MKKIYVLVLVCLAWTAGLSGWTSTGSATSMAIGPLSYGTTYPWHLRARNAIDTILSNGSASASLSYITAPLPSAFSKESPTNGATYQSLTPTLSWTTSTNATEYQYCYDTSNDNGCSNWASAGAATSVGLSGLSMGTTYYWHVRAVNSVGTTYSDGEQTAFWSFTTGLPPGAFSKVNPPNGATNLPTSFTMSWGAASAATYYEFCIDTSNDHACSAWGYIGNLTSLSAGGFASETTYFWHVRAVNSFGMTYSNGASTADWSFTIGTTPGAFSKSSPINGASDLSFSLNLNWEAASEATSYEYCYDMSNDNACSNWVDVGSATSAAIGPLPSGTTYYWHVRAKNSIGTTYSNGSATAFWSFTTGFPPGAFSKTSPSNAATDQLLSLSLTWDASSGASSYEFCYDTSDDNACSVWINGGSDTSVPISGLASGTTYYWHVRALNEFGTTYSDGSETAFWSFTTGLPPENFNKLSPSNEATDQPLILTLSWEASPGATSYEYCFDTTDDHECDGAWVSVGMNTSVEVRGLSDDTTYFWQVRALNDFGVMYANGEVWWSFTTEDVEYQYVFLPMSVK